jgi:uncharacterized membrane protein HdeD (DUF308 family)
MSENTDTAPDVADIVAGVGGSRWWWVGYGVLSVIAGLIALAWPGVTNILHRDSMPTSHNWHSLRHRT